MTHIDNLDYMIQTGIITCPNHPDADADYINIGDTTLISSRKSKEIQIAPGGTFSDYVIFYFGPRSPMLYKIQKGSHNVEKRKPEEIVYLVSSFNAIKEADKAFLFTDGHAYHNMSQFFNREEDLNEIDWKAVNLRDWYDTADDSDRKRRKQAEFLVYHELPFSAISHIAVYNERSKSIVLSKFMGNDISDTVEVIIKPKWYY